MKKNFFYTLFIIVLLFNVNNLFAKNNPLNITKQDTTIESQINQTVIQQDIFDRAEVMPSFLGGIPALFDFIKSNLQYPSLAFENGLEGKVIVKFVVEKDGSITNAVVLKDGVGGGCADEALRIINNMPKWKPGTQRGKPVRTYYLLPVNFTLKN